MRDTFNGIFNELREIALIDSVQLKESLEHHPAWQGANLIEHFMGALQKINENPTNAQQIAIEALDVELWIIGGLRADNDRK